MGAAILFPQFLRKLLAVQKVLSGSGRAWKLRMGKYLGHRLVARPELGNTFGTDSTQYISWSHEKQNGFPTPLYGISRPVA